jgi:PIN domain nuclease of toxin-antitoxin system
MKLLLDTHALIWAVMAPERLGAKARTLIEAEGAEVFASHVSLWEMAIKRRLGKLEEIGDAAGAWFTNYVPNSGMVSLPLSAKHFAEVEFLPSLHGDPFDRLLVTQARTEKLTIVTIDSMVMQYDVATIW